MIEASDRSVGIADLYEPVDGGWQIWITDDEQAPRPEPGSRIGAVAPLPGSTGHEHNPELEKRLPRDDPRLHRRPLFPPAARSLLWNDAQLEMLRRISFRPLVLAYNAPRFVFWMRESGRVRIDWEAPEEAAVHLRLPLRASSFTRSASTAGRRTTGRPGGAAVDRGGCQRCDLRNHGSQHFEVINDLRPFYN